MTPEELDKVAQSFTTFHQHFAPLYGRSEARLRSEQYLRSLQGWYHHMSMALLAGAFLLQMQQEWGERCPR